MGGATATAGEEAVGGTCVCVSVYATQVGMCSFHEV